MPRNDFHYLPDPYFGVYRNSHCRNLPHIHAYGAIYHCCFRLFDSMPQEQVKKWCRQLNDYMAMITSSEYLNNERRVPRFDPTSLAGQFYLHAGAGEYILRNEPFAQVMWTPFGFGTKSSITCMHWP